MILRPYKPSDCEEMAQLFYDTVHTVNAGDYTPQQLNAWATGNVDLDAWNRSFLEHTTVVALKGGTIVGFGDMTDSGYLDRLYVHKDHQREKIATAICQQLEKAVCAHHMETHASITAKPFFERMGYQVVKEQQVQRQGVWLPNYVMQKKAAKQPAVKP